MWCWAGIDLVQIWCWAGNSVILFESSLPLGLMHPPRAAEGGSFGDCSSSCSNSSRQTGPGAGASFASPVSAYLAVCRSLKSLFSNVFASPRQCRILLHPRLPDESRAVPPALMSIPPLVLRKFTF